MGKRYPQPTLSRVVPDVGQFLAFSFLVGTPVVLFVALRAVPALDLLFQSVTFHLIVVSGIAACALVVALLAAVAAGRARGFPLVMLALGCLSVGGFMLVHGLTTPGIFGRPMNMWVARFPVLALSIFALCLTSALLPRERALPRLVERHVRVAIWAPGALLAILCAAVVAWPAAWIGGHPLAGEDVASKILSAVSGLALVTTGEVHRRRWRLSRDKVELALLLACWLSAESIASLQLGRFWRLSWWDYHALLLVGFGAAVYAVVAGYRRSRTVEGALTSVVLSTTLGQIQHGYPEAVRSLVTAAEARDSYTQGHSTRVAELSVRIGEHLGLRPDVLRSLAQGGLLHDIGKIGVPDLILNKPGVLTGEERVEIEKHPAVGWDIVRQAPSLRRALTVVRHHHERVDGTGYPDRLAGREIPLEARIAAVADVWDALTSDRAYRPAHPVERALEIMIAGRGTHFAPDPLDAMLDLLDRDDVRPVGRASTEEDGQEACHPTGRPAVVSHMTSFPEGRRLQGPPHRGC
jgi:HD-GYP domain-containing protein (c-di-GMP phosphodiesterase class II)